MSAEPEQECIVCRRQTIVVHVEQSCLCGFCFNAMSRLIEKQPHRDTVNLPDLISSLRSRMPLARHS